VIGSEAKKRSDGKDSGEEEYRRAYCCLPGIVRRLLPALWDDLPVPEGMGVPAGRIHAGNYESYAETAKADHLYVALSALDTKASGLLNVNSIIIATLALVFGVDQDVPNTSKQAGSALGFAAFAVTIISVFLLLRVLNVRWSTLQDREGPPVHLICARAKRTVLYRAARYLTGLAFLILAAAFFASTYDRLFPDAFAWLAEPEIAGLSGGGTRIAGYVGSLLILIGYALTAGQSPAKRSNFLARAVVPLLNLLGASLLLLSLSHDLLGPAALLQFSWLLIAAVSLTSGARALASENRAKEQGSP
jgi:hypothetical protein